VPAGAGAGDDAVLDDLAPDLKLNDLPTLGQDLGGDRGAGAPAIALTAQRYSDALVRVFGQLVRGAWMALLPTRLAPGRLALRARRWLPERRLRRRRLVGIVAVLVQAGFQLGDALLQLLHQGPKGGVLRTRRATP